MHEHIREKLLGWWAHAVTIRPKIVVYLALGGAGVSIILCLFGLSIGPLKLDRLAFQSDRNDLLSRSLEWNKQFIDWQESFPGNDELTVIIDSHGPDGEADGEAEVRAEFFGRKLAGVLARDTEFIRDVFWGYPQGDVNPRAIRVQEMDAFEQQLEQLVDSRIMLASETPADFVGGVMAEATRRMAASALASDGASNDDQQMLLQLEQFINAYSLVINAAEDEPVDFAGAFEDFGDENRWVPLRSRNNRFIFMRVKPVAEESINSVSNAVEVVRGHINSLRKEFPSVDVGMTGVEVVEADETRAATRDSTRSTAIAVILIAIVLIAAFHSWRVPLLALIALLVGIAWSFGFLTIAVGHLQVLSVVFMVILLGLGIDFAIHLASRYETLRFDYADTSAGFRDAMAATFKCVGPGLITGAVTTCAAFGVLWITNWNRFRGTAELGLIAAAGIMLCLLSMCAVFPALLRIYKRRHRHLVPLPDRSFHFFEEHWVMPFAMRPVTTLIGVLIVTAAAGFGASKVLSTFDYNLLNLLPNNVESMQWQKRITTEGEQPIWYGVCIVSDAEQVEPLIERYRALDTVAEVGGMGLLYPGDDERKIELLTEARREFGGAIEKAMASESVSVAPDSDTNLAAQLGAMRMVIRLAGSKIPEDMQPAVERLDKSTVKLVEDIESLPPDVRDARLDRLQREYRAFRIGVAHLVDRALDPTPLQLTDLPARIQRWYKSSDGRYLIEIYPKLPEGINDPLNPAFLNRFVADLRSVDAPGASVTGATIQFYESGRLIWSSFRNAGLIALLVVFVLVLMDFQSLSDAFLAMVPVVLAFVWLGGIMYAIGQRINPANIMVLPLLFGIGVDAGVHVLHRYRTDPTLRPLGLAGGTGKGITITSLTTMIGFASMIPASHRGIRSLGIVLSLGILMTLLCCWIVLPAWLELRQRRRENRHGESLPGRNESTS